MVDVKEAADHLEAGSGLPVVMLPGAEGSKQFWRYQLEALAGEGFLRRDGEEWSVL